MKLLSFCGFQLSYCHCFAAWGIFHQYLTACISRSQRVSFSQQALLFHRSSLTQQWHICCKYSPILLYLPSVYWKITLWKGTLSEILFLQDFITSILQSIILDELEYLYHWTSFLQKNEAFIWEEKKNHSPIVISSAF